MFKSYFFLGLGIGMVISGVLFSTFSNNQKIIEKSNTKLETIQNVKDKKEENLETEEFKKLLQEIDKLKNSNETEIKKIDKKESEEEIKKNDKEKSIETEKKNDNINKTKKNKEKKNIQDNEEKVIEKNIKKNDDNKKESFNNDTSTKKTQENIKKNEKKIIEKNSIKDKSENKKNNINLENKNVKTGNISIIENKFTSDPNSENYQIQFRSSKNYTECESVQKILSDVIDTDIVLLGEYYRVFSRDLFSKEIASDVSTKIKNVYNLNTLVWMNNYKIIFKKDNDIKNCESLQKKLKKYVDTTIEFRDNQYVLKTSKPISRNLAKDFSEYINNTLHFNLKIIIEQIS